MTYVRASVRQLLEEESDQQHAHQPQGSAMKILHAADLHIDSPLRGLSAYEGAPVDKIRGATRRAVENLVSTAIDNAVDLVVIAGDVFDGDWRDFSTGLFWVGQLARLNDEGIPVVFVAGNHDAASEISRSLRLPPNVTQLATNAPETKIFDTIGVAVTGQGYATRAVNTDLAANFPTPDSHLFSLGLLHTSLDGREGHANYAPTTLETLRSKGYNYWALGHVHEREIVHQDPWIVFPGNLQGRHARELGPKGAILLTVESNEITAVEFIPLDALRWQTTQIDITDLQDLDAVLNAAETAIGTATNTDDSLTAMRLHLVGAAPAHNEIWRNPHAFEAELRALTNVTNNVWLEKIKLDTTRPHATNPHDDEVMDSLTTRVATLHSHPEQLVPFEAAFTDLRRKIAADARGVDGSPTNTTDIGSPEHLAEHLNGSLELIAALLAEGDNED
jgi:exonuclease SbcD